MDKEQVKKFKNMPLLSIAQHYGFRFSPVGGKLRGLCLFHGDVKTPNLFLYPDDTFFCYGCKRGWSKSQFVAYAEKVQRRVIDELWERSTPLPELMSMKLQAPKINYRNQLLLLLANFVYNKRQVDPSFTIDKIAAIDAMLESRTFIDLDTYTEVVQKIKEMP